MRAAADVEALPDAAFFDAGSIEVLEAFVEHEVRAGAPSQACSSAPCERSAPPSTLERTDAATTRALPLTRAPPPRSSTTLRQTSSSDYNARANRGLLRLYQLFPHLAKAEVVEAVLLRALMALPEPDFVHAVSLLPDGGASTQHAAALSRLEQLLQTAHFGEFWAQCATPELATLIARVPGFAAAVRAFIAGVLNRTYRRVGLAALAEALGLPAAADAAAWGAQQGWAVDAHTAELPALPENAPRPVKKAGEDGLGLRYSEALSVLKVADSKPEHQS